MQLSEFHVVQVNSEKPYRIVIYTDDIQETLNTEYKDENVTLLEEKDWTIEDYCTIVESLLEDVNAHKYCNKIYDIIDTMRTVFISDIQIKEFLKQYVRHMFELYGY